MSPGTEGEVSIVPPTQIQPVGGLERIGIPIAGSENEDRVLSGL
jgi:hypothetical protein